MVFMSINIPPKSKKISLKGAVQINKNSFFVFKDALGKIFVNSGKNEKLHKSVVESMMNDSPFVKKILKRYHIRPLIDTKTLKNLAGGHMNDTCNIAMGVYSILSEQIKSQVNKETLQEALKSEDYKIKFMNEPDINTHLRITLGRPEQNRIVINTIKKVAGK